MWCTIKGRSDLKVKSQQENHKWIVCLCVCCGRAGGALMEYFHTESSTENLFKTAVLLGEIKVQMKWAVTSCHLWALREPEDEWVELPAGMVTFPSVPVANVTEASEMSFRARANCSQVNIALALSRFIDALMQHQWLNIGEWRQFLYREVVLQTSIEIVLVASTSRG